MLDRLHRELGDGAEDPLAVLIGAGVGDLQRQDLGQRPIRDHDRRGVDRRVADDALEPLGDVDDLLGRPVAIDLGPQRLAGSQALGKARRPAHDRVRNQLGQAVSGRVVVAQHARRVAGRRAGEHLAEGDDLGDGLLAVLLGHVADHAFAAADREVHVDIGHRYALGIEKALEQQVVAERVHVGDLQRVGHQRAGCRPAPRSHGDARVLGVLDEVPDDQEVGVEAHPVDHAELVLGSLDRFGRHRVPIAATQPFVDETAQVRPLLLAIGRRVARNQLAAELKLDITTLGDLRRGGDRLRPLGEGVDHLLARAQVELVGVEADLRSAEQGLRLHAQQRRVMVVVLTTQVVDVAGADQGAAELAGNADDLLVAVVLEGEAVLLNLEVDVPGSERGQELVSVTPRLGHPAVGEVLAEAGLQAAGEDDHALGVGGQLLHVDRGLAALKPVQEPGRGEFDQVAIARVVLGQQREVEPLELARASSRVIVDDVDLAADDRLDPVLATGREELDRPVHDPVVGQTEGGLVK